MTIQSNYKLIEYINEIIKTKENKVKENNKIKKILSINIGKNVDIKKIQLYIKRNIIFIINQSIN